MIDSLKSKKETSVDLIKSLEHLLVCPLCSSPMTINEHLSCLNNHSFDLSKTGYLNLNNEPDDPHYTRDLFEHRHIIMGSNQFYKPLVAMIEKELSSCEILLDAGTGEGSLLNQIKIPGIKVGLDLSKQGIQTSAKYYRDSLWMVADLAKIPFKNESVDAMLSILSPANYKEFKRVLKKEATLIKVLPGINYFKELRDYNNLEEHNSDAVLERFNEEFDDFRSKSLNYQISVNEITRKSVLIMSPLAWNMSPDHKNNFIKHGPETLTIDLIVLIAKNKKTQD